MNSAHSVVAQQFEDAEQQHAAATLGMWMFLATEVLFFGGLLTAYLVYRLGAPAGFSTGSAETNFALGTLNTGILLTSSLTMALAVHAIQLSDRKACVRHLLTTFFLGVIFLAVKAAEYREEISKHLVPGAGFASQLPHGAEMFFYLYWCLTGVHALHLIAGLAMLIALAIGLLRGGISAGRANPVEMGGLYWHFVDCVWIVLYPLIYLIPKLP